VFGDPGIHNGGAPPPLLRALHRVRSAPTLSAYGHELLQVR
jgi:hypothetical protein